MCSSLKSRVLFLIILTSSVSFAQITFNDVSEDMDVDDTGNAWGVAIVDYNNDGWPDIFVANGGGSVLYKNRGEGQTFQNATTEAGVVNTNINYAPAFGDYNNDGK